jgi:lysophospholipase L1-like esterase
MCWRLSNIWHADVVAMRLRIANKAPLAEASALFGASFTATYAGPQALDASGNPTGGFVAAPTQAFAAFTLPADGSEYVGPWVSPAGAMPTYGTPWLFSFAYTGGATSGGGQRAGTVNTWYNTSAGSSAKVNQTSASTFTQGSTAPFDIRIEFQFQSSGLTGIGIGDSITWGTGGALVPGQYSYPSIYSRRTGNLMVNAGIPSSTLAQWAGASSEWKWQRLASALTEADFVTIALGTNSLATGAAAMQTAFQTILTTVRTLVGATKPVYGTTIPPRNLPHSRLAANAIAGATTLVLNDATLPSGSARLGAGPTVETVTVSASPTGTGPYTYTVTALANAHVIGEFIARGSEIERLNFNDWLRGLPNALAGCIDHDLALAADYDRGILRPEFGQSDGLHPTAAGCTRMAEVVPVVLPSAKY